MTDVIEIVEVFNVLPQLQAGLHDQVQQVLNDGADILAQHIQDSIDTAWPPPSSPGEQPHLRTGDLLLSILAVRESGELEAMVQTDSPYASYLEYGTVRMGARPFFAVGVDEVVPAIQEQLDDLLLQAYGI